MSASGSSKFTWDNPSDVLQGIMAPRITPTSSSHAELSSDGLTSSELALGDPTSFLGLQFGTDSGVPPHFHAPSILNHFLPHKQSASPTSQQFDYTPYHHSRLTNNQDAWNPLQVTGVPPNSSAFPMLPMNKAHQMYGFDRRYSAGQYSTPSENGSQYNGLHSSDSGYSTQSCTTRSIAASYAVDSACSPYLAPHDYEQDEKVSTLDINSTHFNEPMDVNDQPESPSIIGNDAIKCDYPNCQWTGKCPSDKRKHEARHKKLFKCDEPNCTRKEGFGTINDLARHKKCVHKQEPERGPKVLYMCFGHNCPRRNKKWPRLDNFRQHLARMHNEEDIDDLLKKSHDWYEDCVKPQEMAASLIDRFSEEPALLHTQNVSDSENMTTDLVQEPSNAVIPSQIVLQSPDMPMISPVKKLDDEYEDQGPEPRSTQSVELPTLRSLNLESALEQKTSIASQLDSPKTDKMDEMISEAAVNMINAMTKIINNNQRRRSQQIDDTVDLEQQDGELSDRKREMLQRILTAALEKLSKNTGPPNNGAQEPTNYGSDKKGWIQCEFCTKRTRLRCEMKKHKKRHERPYGCTFHKCNKTFGSKADWKRHENSQHFHLQSWRCTLPDATQAGLPCARLYYRQEIYVQHLKNHHSVDDEEEVRTAICKNRIGRNGQSQFWCGFCRDIIPLRSQGLAAWNERFNHIDIEHFKKGERIGDWLLPSGHLTKDREREEEKMRAKKNDNSDESEPIADENSDDESVCSSDHSDTEPLPEDPMTIEQDMSQDQPYYMQFDDGQLHTTANSISSAKPANFRKRKLQTPPSTLDPYQYGNGEASNIEKKSRTQMTASQPHPTLVNTFDVYGRENFHPTSDLLTAVQRGPQHRESISCCQCSHGPYSLSFRGNCLYCQHTFCHSCHDESLPATAS